MAKLLAFGLIGLMMIGAALFSVQNAASVTVQLLFWRSIELPLGLVMSLGFASGLLLAVIIPSVWRFTDVYGDADEVAFATNVGLENDGEEEW